ncbi:MAG: transposase [Sphaerochaeta sp.]|nr:transposase [Sphaerochaeta sp.]
MPDASGSSLQSCVCDAVAPSSMVHTDGWGGYNKLTELGYPHEVTDMSSSDDPAHISMPGGSSDCKSVETVASRHSLGICSPGTSAILS